MSNPSNAGFKYARRKKNQATMYGGFSDATLRGRNVPQCASPHDPTSAKPNNQHKMICLRAYLRLSIRTPHSVGAAETRASGSSETSYFFPLHQILSESNSSLVPTRSTGYRGRNRGAIPYRSGRRRQESTTLGCESAAGEAPGLQGGLGQPEQTRIKAKPMQACSAGSCSVSGVPWPLPPCSDRS
ncbi:uncharacterized protein BDZ83DRAFT_646263 [Colletotrichum acutatum]|uniref:Uncharacterized protein n=1 Tax=Glomerella acutata TaxID=27357 RepID=A0AAD8XPI9_GLOAC|nr:uncharacterized protein BDZ83DRAFT_646263 [Colletotrichum acutatum]KAK1731297.1 hypothetical protein BDZ83DRAFT_646263 [Colletotrichum acutatum]